MTEGIFLDWGKLSRKLSLLALAAGVTISTVPGGVSAAGAVQPNIDQSTLPLVQSSQKTFISPQINTKSTDDIRVIVQLSGQPAAVGKYAAKQGISSLASTATEAAVDSQQTDVLKKASNAGLDLEVNYKYNTVLNGFEITIPANEIPELAKIPGVISIHKNSTWYAVPVEGDTSAAAAEATTPQNDNEPLKQIHADWAWANGYTGKGLKVGVIDTGVDYTHPDIKDAYKGGYDSFYNDNDPYEEVPLTKENDPYHVGYEGTYHGTHVAGTIIGQFANKSGEIAQKGVAPGAELYAYKVLGRNLDRPSTSSGSSAQVIDGIERAVKDHMDVINLSLGSDEEKDVNSPDAIAINNAVLSGVTAVIANGNAGPGEYTLGSPATSQLGISVGAVTSPSKQFSGKFKAELERTTVSTVTYETYGDVNFNLMAWGLGKENFANIIGTKPVNVVYAGLGGKADFENIQNVEGSIVLVSRGLYAFTEKIANAKEHGAKAIVIFNGNAKQVGDENIVDLSPTIPNRDGFINSGLGDGFDNIPTLDIKGSEGRALARTLAANPGSSFRFTFDDNYNPQLSKGDALASFTSFGPNVDDNLSIKPDFTAPGVGILSTWPAYGKGKDNVPYDKAYNRISGTSMATPHVAGLALLIKEAHPTWSPFDIRAALANTAEPNEEYSVYEQGAGRVNVENAISTPALVQALEPITILDKNYKPQNVINYNSSAAYGVIQPGTSAIKNVQLKNTSKDAVSYSASVEWHFEDPQGITVTPSISTVSADGGKVTPFSLNLNVGNNVKEGFYEGQLNLAAPGVPTLHLPFSVYVGKELPENPFGIQEIKLSNALVYPNRNYQSSTDLTFRLSAEDTNYYEVNIVNLEDHTIGYVDVQFNAKQSFTPGLYSVKSINGSYHPVDANGKKIVDASGKPVTEYLKDGVYKIYIYASHIDAPGEAIESIVEKEIEYKGYSSFRVDNSYDSNSGGSTGGGGGGPVATPAPSTAPAPVSGAANAVIDQGLKQAPVKAAVASSNGVATVTVTNDDLKSAIASASASPAAIVINAPATTDATAKVALTAEQVKLLAGAPAKSTIIVNAAGSAFALPVSLLTGGAADASLDLIIKKADDQSSKFSTTAGSTVVGSPVAFEANWTKASGSTALKVPNDAFIKRSFTIPGKVEPNTAGVLFESNGKITPVSSVFKVQADGTTLVTVSRPGFSVYAAVSRPVTFSDIANSPAAADITALANKLIIEGTSATTFSPKSNLTRAEFTALLSRSLGLRSSSTSTFTDVKSSDWYANDVAAASEAGLILGIGNGKFAPNAQVTRQELAVILGRAVKLTGVELKASNPSFTTYADSTKIAPYAKDSVQSLSAAGIISSEVGSNFNPTTAATRETVAATLHQLLSKTGLID
ncbi:S8 family serine peptidase [Paenibacillus sp. JW14]|uniref:S8 family serine peptidase n=1 Tax=Paenibacillus agri TaxID=2744309 RepID=A0A850ERZ9_9BACL|nr:S8 family serine peptidase [Paenibacillus agri]